MSDGGVIASVEPGPALDAGLACGDIVLAVDGTPVRDVLDWWWLTAEDEFTVSVRRGAEELRLEVTTDAAIPLGVTFTDVLFGPVLQCDNACAFCFISGLPPGLRPALYVRDDDFRLSFLSGNFITLTNLTESDVARILEQRLSPLHVSVHAVDPAVRRRLICPTADDRALEIMDMLVEGGIEIHVQIVLVPGVNDGAVLEETLAYLAAREGVRSVGCVPMAYTAHQSRWNASYDRAGAASAIGAIERWQAAVRPQRDSGWVYAADEFYLLAAIDIPSAEAYDDFCQFENGIGMVAAFGRELPAASVPPAADITVVTGDLFAPVLRDLLGARGWTGVRVLSVANDLFGGNVTVAGLLAGRDIIRAIAEDGRVGTYLVPDVVVNSDGLLIDDVPAAVLGDRAAADVHIIGSDASSLAEALMTRQGRAFA